MTPTWIKIAADNIVAEHAGPTRATVRKLIADAFRAQVVGYPNDGECFSCGCCENENGECESGACYRGMAVGR